MSTVTAPARLRCPNWCELPEDRHDVVMTSRGAVVDHDGPMFGEFLSATGMTFAGTGEVTIVEVSTTGCIEGAAMDSAGLRKLAADALAAAEWLEAVTEAGH